MVRSIGKILVKSKLKKTELSRNKGFLPWDKVNKLAILIEKDAEFSKFELDEFIDKCKKMVDIYYLETSNKIATFSDWNCLTKNHKSLFGLPIKSVEQNILTKKYDLIINTCKSENLYAISLAISAQATMHCGFENNFNEPDFVVLKSGNQKLIGYLTNLMNYLKMLREN